ncbi:MAG TPA: hypothetical protein VFA48_08945, partial [Gammaproteobacteria bacterium]|nr:hypothetical protein [Gammaproteobacteria bacterium]
LVTWVTYQAFKLVTLLSEQVPRWIGQLGTQLGEHAEARGHRTTIVGGIGRGGRKGGEAAGRAMRTATAVSRAEPDLVGQAGRGPNPEPPGEAGGTGPDPGVDTSSTRGKNPDDPGEQS